MSDLREKLFEQLDRLSNPKCDLEAENTRAACIVQVAAVIVDTARVEVEFIHAVNGDSANGSGFFEQKKITR